MITKYHISYNESVVALANRVKMSNRIVVYDRHQKPHEEHVADCCVFHLWNGDELSRGEFIKKYATVEYGVGTKFTHQGLPAGAYKEVTKYDGQYLVYETYYDGMHPSVDLPCTDIHDYFNNYPIPDLRILSDREAVAVHLLKLPYDADIEAALAKWMKEHSPNR